MEVTNFQDDIPSIPLQNFEDNYVPVFDLTSMEDATENYHYTELVEEPQRLGLTFTFPLEHVAELIILGKRMSPVAVDKIGVVGKKSKMYVVSLQQTVNHIPQLNYRYPGSFFSDYVPTLDNDTAIVNTQASNIQGVHWVRSANICHKL